MKILIIGGESYIGAELIELLSKNNLEIRATTRNRATLVKKNKIQWDYYNLNNISANGIKSSIKWSDVIIHTVSQVKPRVNFSNSKIIYNVEQDALIEILNYVKTYSDKHFIYISSGGSIYGELKDNIFGNNESMVETPIDFYGSLKLASENLIKMKLINSANYTILRVANVYSFETQKDLSTGLIRNIKNAIRGNGTISIIENGLQTRDYIHISDVLFAFTKLLESGPQSSSINIGTGVETSVVNLILAASSNRDLKIVSEISEKKTIQRSKLDIRYALKQLSWSASIDIYKGLSNYLNKPDL